MFKNDLYKMLERWDRTKGHVGRPLTPADEDDAAAGNARNQKRQKPVSVYVWNTSQKLSSNLIIKIKYLSSHFKTTPSSRLLLD